MKGRAALVLLALAAGLTAFVLLWEKDQPGTAERLASAGKLVPNLDPEKVDKLTLKRREDTVVASRQQGRWRLEQPIAESADDLVILGIVRELAEAPVFTRIAASEVAGGETATGLGEDAAVANLVFSGREVVVRIGARDIGAGRRYAQVGTAPELAVINGSVAQALEKPIEKLRDHTLFESATIDVRQFSLQPASGPTLRFERRHGEAWWITSPLEDAADNGAVSGLLSKILSLRAELFLSSPPDVLPGASAPWLVATLFDATGGSRGALTIGDAVPGTASRFAVTDRRPQPFQLRAAELDLELRKPPGEWRSMLALDTSVWDLSELELRRNDQHLRLRRGQDAGGQISWVVADPAGVVIDDGKVVTLTSTLARVESKRLADEQTWSSAGLDSPTASVTLRHEDPLRFPDSVLWIGAPAGPNEFYAGVPGRRTVLVVDAAFAAQLDPATLKR